MRKVKKTASNLENDKKIATVTCDASDSRRVRTTTRHTVGRAASGGASAPEPPRATRSQPESGQFHNTHFFRTKTFFVNKVGLRQV